MKKLYLLDSKLKWKTFKKLHDSFVKDSGPKPKHIEKILWKMLRDKQIYCWFASDLKNDMGIGLKLPTGYKIYLIQEYD